MTVQIETAMAIGGRVEQQDRVVSLRDARRETGMLVLGDGMGGHRNGAAAAQVLIDTATRAFRSGQLQEPGRCLQEVCAQAHAAIRALDAGGPLPPGSTCVMFFWKRDEAYWSHVGDSRLYHFQGDRLLFRTEDHSVAELLPDGLEQAAGDHSIPGHRLYMCLGGATAPEPAMGATVLTEDDWFVLCSDGLWQSVTPQEIADAVGDTAITAAAATNLVTLATRRGGPDSDNVSLGIVRPRAKRSVWGSVQRRLLGFAQK